MDVSQLFSIQYAVFSVQNSLLSVQSSVFSVQRSVFSVKCHVTQLQARGAVIKWNKKPFQISINFKRFTKLQKSIKIPTKKSNIVKTKTKLFIFEDKQKYLLFLF